MLSVFSRFHSWVLAEEVVSALSLRARSSPALQVWVTGSHGRKLSGHLTDRHPQIDPDRLGSRGRTWSWVLETNETQTETDKTSQGA